MLNSLQDKTHESVGLRVLVGVPMLSVRTSLSWPACLPMPVSMRGGQVWMWGPHAVLRISVAGHTTMWSVSS